MLIFISDLHLREGLHSHLSKADQFARFWRRISAHVRDEPAQLVLLGDVFDLVRAPAWLAGDLRPYHEPSDALAAEIEALVRATLVWEKDFFEALREQVEWGNLVVHYVTGNHDRLINASPGARRAVREALGQPVTDEPFPTEIRFPEHEVLAYHGHRVDSLCFDPDGGAPMSDILASELIVRFPVAIRSALGIDDPRLDDIDDVRPIFAVPSWVKSLVDKQEKGIGKSVARVWSDLVGEFLELPAAKDWFDGHHTAFRLDHAQQIRLLLSLSAKGLRMRDRRFQDAYKLLFGMFDTKFAKSAWLALKEEDGLRFAVNGHTHFAGMNPLGLLDGKPACYFNTGTWRTVHQLGSAHSSEAFLAYDAMAYLVFFGDSDPMGRRFEWWQGAAGR